MMEDLITDLRNMTGMGRFARAEVREILGYLESVGWLSEPEDQTPVEGEVSDVITNITPTKTPFMSVIAADE